MVPRVSRMSTLPQLARVITQAASQTLAWAPRLTTWRWEIDWKTVRSAMAGSFCRGQRVSAAMR